MPLVGHQHQIDILELTDKGDGKGRLFDRPLFVEGLLPGEQALVELTEVKPNYLHGKLVELTRKAGLEINSQFKFKARLLDEADQVITEVMIARANVSLGERTPSRAVSPG